jgi:lipopolysaccharide/colanic/teichoic acid biosynthesis glycosyltransferase
VSRISAAPAHAFKVSRIGPAERARADHCTVRLESPGNTAGAGRMRGLQNSACRAVNLVVATVGIALTLPLMLALAALIRVTSPGPVFYTQPRVGLNRRDGMDRRGGGRGVTKGRRQGDVGGRVFRIFKFRTMHVLEGEHRQMWATENDPRVTGVGSIQSP